ncbi:hypothetical protein M885DRAFT_545100 [Pelagophyceae sp. CCMP2097]|nr:hypothetical protein M885DRAFT_545100 [Pelagophyceae sp. CCMP2097]
MGWTTDAEVERRLDAAHGTRRWPYAGGVDEVYPSRTYYPPEGLYVTTDDYAPPAPASRLRSAPTRRTVRTTRYDTYASRPGYYDDGYAAPRTEVHHYRTAPAYYEASPRYEAPLRPTRTAAPATYHTHAPQRQHHVRVVEHEHPTLHTYEVEHRHVRVAYHAPVEHTHEHTRDSPPRFYADETYVVRARPPPATERPAFVTTTRSPALYKTYPSSQPYYLSRPPY